MRRSGKPIDPGQPQMRPVPHARPPAHVRNLTPASMTPRPPGENQRTTSEPTPTAPPPGSMPSGGERQQKLTTTPSSWMGCAAGDRTGPAVRTRLPRPDGMARDRPAGPSRARTNKASRHSARCSLTAGPLQPGPDSVPLKRRGDGGDAWSLLWQNAAYLPPALQPGPCPMPLPMNFALVRSPAA